MLGSAIAGFLEEAAQAWPQIRVSAEGFAAHVTAKVPPGSPAEAVTELRGAELFLVYACLTGNAEAWRVFDRSYLAKVPDYVARVDRSPAFADEVRQRIAEKLATPTEDGQTRLAQYSGRGPLHSWLRIAALREAHTVARRRKNSIDSDDVPLRAPDLDPELALLKQRSVTVFRKAFHDVIASLSDDDRTLLRLHYLDGLTIDQVGKASKVSRASAARLLAQTRERIVKRVERALRDDLGANAPGARSLLALVRSQLDLSIVRHFRAPTARPADQADEADLALEAAISAVDVDDPEG